MQTTTRIAAILITVLAAASCVCAGYISAPPGCAVQDTVFAIPPGGYPASFDVLPSGDFVVHTGQQILEVKRNGSSSVIYSYPEPVYGSLVKVDERRRCIFFGESSTGIISVMDLDGGNPRDIAQADFNFDLELNSKGEVYVVWGAYDPITWAAVSRISKLHLVTGELDLIAEIDGPTGSIAFDRRDNLIYGTVSPVWGELGGQKIVRFSARQVRSAEGDGWLVLNDGEILLDDVDSPYDIAFDNTGRVCFTSTVAAPSAIWREKWDWVYPMSSVDPSGILFLTTLRWNEAARSFSTMVGGMYDDNWNPVGVISTLVRGKGRAD